MRHNAKRLLSNRLLQAAVYIIIAAFLIDSLIKGWDQIKAYPWKYDIPGLVAAALLLIVNVVGQGALWTWAIRRMDVALPYGTGVRIFLTSQLAKYVPGGVWSFANVAYSAQRLGLSGSLLTLMFILSTLLVVGASAVFAAPILPAVFPGFPVRLDYLVTACLVVALVAGPFLLRIALLKIAQWRKLDTSAIQIAKITTYRSLLFMFLVVLLLHIFSLASFALFLQTTTETAPLDSLQAALAWNTAWLAGFLFLPAPSGLGIREYVLVLLLQPLMPQGIAAVISVAHRVFMTAADLVLLVVIGLTRSQDANGSLRTNNK